jgi:hypothetical protein
MVIERGNRIVVVVSFDFEGALTLLVLLVLALGMGVRRERRLRIDASIYADLMYGARMYFLSAPADVPAPPAPLADPNDPRIGEALDPNEPRIGEAEVDPNDPRIGDIWFEVEPEDLGPPLWSLAKR